MPELSPESHDAIIKGIGRLEGHMENVISRLDKVNGNIATLYNKAAKAELDLATRSAEAERSLAKHSADCDVKNRLAVIEKSIASGASAETEGRRVTKQWQSWMRPMVWVLLGGVAILLLMSADKLLKLGWPHI